MRKHILVTIALIAVSTQNARADKPGERRLYTDRVEASSFDWNDWNRFQENYHPNYVGDDDPQTAWTEGAKGTGAGEWIRVHHTELEGVSNMRLKIRNGYQKSPSLFKKNARAKDITIKMLPDGPTQKLTLMDTSGWQSIAFQRPAGKQDGYEIRIDSVYPGTHYEDLCISDIQTFVTATTRDNPGFEKKKKSDLLAWKKQRVDAAKAFQSSAGKSLPLGPMYTLKHEGEEVSGEPCNFADECLTRNAFTRAKKAWPARKEELASMQTIIEGKFKDWAPVTIGALDKRTIPLVEGFHFPHPAWEGQPLNDVVAMPAPGLVAYLTANQMRRTYPPGVVSMEAVKKAEHPDCKNEDEVEHFFWSPKEAGKNEAAPLRFLLVMSCGRFEERDGYYQAAMWQLLAYNHDGQLDMIVGPGQLIAFGWGNGKKGPIIASAHRISALGFESTRLTLAGETATP